MTHVKKLIGLSSAVMLVVWAAGTSFAAVPDTTKSKHTQPQKIQHSMIQTVYGTVSAVQPGVKTVEVTVPWGQTDRLTVGATIAEIKEGKTRKSPADLKVGEHVRMKFEGINSDKIAKPIIIKLEKQRS